MFVARTVYVAILRSIVVFVYCIVGWQQAEYVAAKIMAIAHALTPYTDSNSFAAATATAAAAASKAPRVACSQPQMAAVAAARKLWHVK